MKVTVLLLFIIIVYFISSYAHNADYRIYQNEIKAEYKGVVKNKYFKKVTHIQIDIDGVQKDLAIMSPELRSKVEVGDTIYKMLNRNECELNGVRMRYVSLPDFARDLNN